MMVAVVAASLVLEGSVVAAATRHVVGGSGTGWTIPPNASFYDKWSSSQTFVVGDTLGKCSSAHRLNSTIKNSDRLPTLLSLNKSFSLSFTLSHPPRQGD